MLIFCNIYVEKHVFHATKKCIDHINHVDIEHIVVSSKYSSEKRCFRYFIGYANPSNNDKTPLHMKLHKEIYKSFQKINLYVICARRKK